MGIRCVIRMPTTEVCIVLAAPHVNFSIFSLEEDRRKYPAEIRPRDLKAVSIFGFHFAVAPERNRQACTQEPHRQLSHHRITTTALLPFAAAAGTCVTLIAPVGDIRQIGQLARSCGLYNG